jgi:hypothetical protein
VLGGIEFHNTTLRDMPVGLVSAPVKVVDLVKGQEQMMTMTAGLLNMTAKKTVKNEDNFVCFQPKAGSWMPRGY